MIAAHLLGELACVLPVDDRTRPVLKERHDGQRVVVEEDRAPVFKKPIVVREVLEAALRAALADGSRRTARELMNVVRMHGVDVEHTTVLRSLNRARREGWMLRSATRVTVDDGALSGSYLWKLAPLRVNR